jgi:putative membrane-bound dehydrogenase-like protein
MDIDHKGRVWVVESVNYRSQLRKQKLRRPEGDRILILQDTTGAGKADKVTVFYQTPDTLAPLGIAVAPHIDGPGCTVYVCQSPDILVFEDKDGDGKADGPPRKLLSGFRGYDHDHGVHGILIGPDAKLYFTVGDQGVSGLVDKYGRTWTSNSSDCRAGTCWRCDLDGKNLEMLAHNFRNHYEPCVDSFGTMFISDNDDDGNQQTRVCYVMPGGNYGYHPRGKGQTHWHEEQPGVVPKILRTYFGSPTGMCVYEGTLLPEKYRGQPLHTEAGPRHLRCYHLKPDGASYAVVREDMVESSDNWFRPADVCIAPDGSVFVVDWYDPGVGGHGMGDTTRGRVFRVAPPKHKPVVPKVDLESKGGLTAALASPNLAVRSMAMAKLMALGLPKALDVLESAATQMQDDVLRARALWQLGRLGSLRLVSAAFSDPDPRFRVLAMRILHDYHGQTPDKYVPDWQGRLLKDTSAAVRREALLFLRRVEAEKAKSLILELAKGYDGHDRFYLAAVGIAVGQEKTRREVILANFDKHFPGWDDKVANLVWELRPPQTLAMAEKRLTEAKIPPEQQARVVDILASASESSAGMVLIKALPSAQAVVRDRIVENLSLHLQAKWSSLRKSPELKRAILSLFQGLTNSRLGGLKLIAAAEQEELLYLVIDHAQEPGRDLVVRLAALRALGSFKNDKVTLVLAQELHNKQHAEIPIEAANALARQGTPAAMIVLQRAAAEAKTPLAVRQAAIAGLAATRTGATWLLKAHADKQLAADLTADLARLLRNSPFPDLQNQALIAFPPPPAKLDPKDLPSIPALLARKGNPERGKQLLAASFKSDAQCLKCHTVRGFGGQVGPDLTVIGSKVSRENLLESLLYPSRAIADQYLQYVLETKDGVQLSGLLIEETPAYLLLRDANAKDHKIARGDLARKTKAAKSIMPDNLTLFLSEEELIDLVDYLHTLKSPALTPARWHFVGPFDANAVGGFKKRGLPPEQGINLNATYEGKNGLIRWRTVEPNAQGYIDVKAALGGGPGDNTVSYLYCEIESPSAQEARFLLGTSGTARLWVNTKLAYTNSTSRVAAPEQDEVRVRLIPGRNFILLRVHGKDGEHGVYFTVLADQEVRLVREK